MRQVIGNLGTIVERSNIRSSIGPFRVFPEYITVYPKSVVEALFELYKEYNHVFIPLVMKNCEWETDYRFCFATDEPVNHLVQVDMVGLTDQFLQESDRLPKGDVMNIVRRTVFEIENSLAMYQLLERLFTKKEQPSFFSREFRRALHGIRNQFGMPIALLAVTREKYDAMLGSEFGRSIGSDISDEDVRELSGFDRFFSPDTFLRHIADHGGKCKYLLYARTSDPIEKLRCPEKEVDHPLLNDPDVRRVIKEYTLTFNVDAQEMNEDSRINDTKAYMPLMNMAYPLVSEMELFSRSFLEHVFDGGGYHNFDGGNHLSDGFSNFLCDFGVSPADIAQGLRKIRAKPMLGTYGCYGHLIGMLSEKSFRKELRWNLRRRGSYVVQPELEIPHIVNEADGSSYAFIDRNFLAMIDGQPTFLGGFRSLMPVNSVEARKGRNHGNRLTVWGEIVL